MTYYIKLLFIFFGVVQLLGCSAGANGLLFNDYVKTINMKDNDATIIVYREHQAGGLGIPIYLNFEEAGILLPRGYLVLTVPALEEHVLNAKEGATGINVIRTSVTLKPKSLQYLKYDLFKIPFVDMKIELVKVEEQVAINDLKLSRNSTEEK